MNSSAKPLALTETETEYVVTCVKHIFKEHVVFQVCDSLHLGAEQPVV
jgi:coatomer protein complex subunit gamma